MPTLIKNIGWLAAGPDLEPIRDAFVLVDEGKIVEFGREAELRLEERGVFLEERGKRKEEREMFCNTNKEEAKPQTSNLKPQTSIQIDAAGGCVIPAYCDSHTHLVWAGSRHGEFVDKIRGLSYEEIAARGGGILNSADVLHETSEDELFEQSMVRVREVISKGTGAIEIKSGYGLRTADELKMLRVIRRIRESVPAIVRSTFLGAHAVGREFAGRQGEYVDYLISETLPAVAEEGLADFIDVFADRGFFTPEETDRLLEAGAKYGLRPKVHVSELEATGALAVAVGRNALSVDHLEHASEEEIDLLARSETIATALPGTSFFLRMPYAPARKLIERGARVAIASDYNPGSTPSGDMRFVCSLACIYLRMTPQEALRAATIRGAEAMGIAEIAGSIERGKQANLIITRPMESLDIIPYQYTSPYIKQVIINGKCEFSG